MGVRGLSSFFDQNPVLSKYHQLYDTAVVIDGSNLVHMLYFAFKVECVYGGDYDKFAAVVHKYFSHYLECSIKPIVVFDGGYDKTDRKLATVLQRTKQRLTNAQHIAKYGCCSGKVLPILSIEVMKDVMRTLGVTFIHCDYEADEHITAIANHFQCPVISQDSDFYIFDISHGFIRLDSIGNTVNEGTDDLGRSFKYLTCQIYLIDKFLSFFPGIDKSVLPLFGTLIGNDYAHISVFENFFSNIQLPKFKPKLKVSQRHKKMIGLLSWLKYITLHDAVTQVLSHLKMNKREQIRLVIERAVESYSVPSSELCNYIKPNAFDDAELKSSSLTTFNGKKLPNWFIQKFRSGDITPFLVNAVGIHRAFLPSQVEEVVLPSSYDCSCYIRQILYGIVLSYDMGKDKEADGGSKIEEYDRRDGSLQRNYVEAVFNVEGFGPLPNLERLSTIGVSQGKHLMLQVLGDVPEYFTSLPSYMELLIGSIRFWLRNCSPKPPLQFLYGLVITFVYFNFAHESTALKETEPVSNANSDLISLTANVTSSDTLAFSRRMKKYFQKPQHNNANPLNIRIIHYFSQLQTCVLYISYLNKLLRNPFSDIRIQKCFNGTVLYNLTRDILSRPFPKLFVSELVGRDSSFDKMFSRLEEKVLYGLQPNCFSATDQRPVTKKKKKNKDTQTSTKETTPVSKESEDDTDIASMYNKFEPLSFTLPCERSVDVLL